MTPKEFVNAYFGSNVFPAKACEGLETKLGCFLDRDNPKEKIKDLRVQGYYVKFKTVHSLNDSVHYLAARTRQ